MIELPILLVRQYRAVVRKSVLAADPRGPCPVVVCSAGRRGLTLSCRQGNIGVRHRTPGSFSAGTVALPYSTLAELEAQGEMVELEQTGPFKGRASWQGSEGPRSLDFDTADPASLPPAPEPARNAVALEPGFLSALDDAARTASRDAERYATNLVQLRGRDGTLVATDGRQLLLQGGFRFPWKDDQYLPALPVFGSRELPRDASVDLGLAKDRITLGVGPWLFDFGVRHQVRFPDVDRVVPGDGTAPSRLRLDAEDIEALTRNLPGLPGRDDPRRPVTLDLGKAVVIRSGSEKGGATSVALPHARWEGPGLRVVVDRRYLLRALGLGFTEILIADARTPLLCKDARRTYLWMPLAEDESAPAAPAPRGDPVPARLAPAAHPRTPRSPTTVSTNDPSRDGEHRNGGSGRGEPIDPVAEAEEIRGHLQAALARTGRLLAALKQQRRQTRVVEAALASLRQLPPSAR